MTTHTPFDPSTLRAADAPSELTLDAYAAGEASPEERARVEAWAAADPAHQAALTARLAGFDALPGVHVGALQARIARAVAAPPAAPWWRRRWLSILAPLAVAATVAVLVVMFGPPPVKSPSHWDEVRVKGAALSLRVFRDRGGVAEELVGGATVGAGDRLRFRPEGVPEGGHLLVVGREAGGALFAYAPIGGASLPRAGLDAEGALPGSAELDASTGREWTWVVWCPAPFALADVAPGEGEALRTPPGCEAAAFPLEKR